MKETKKKRRKYTGHHKVSDPSLKYYKQEHAGIAKDLCYSKEIIDRIWDAESKSEIDIIMTTARMSMR